MAQQAMELKSDKSTEQVMAEAARNSGLVDVQLPLTLSGWNLAQLFQDYGHRPVVLRSADGDVFVAEVSGTDELAYVVTVELS